MVAGGQLDDTRPLRQLLATPNEPLRVDAAAALARFGDPSGVDALGQLAYSRDVAVRQQVAQAMGDLADPRFTPVLIRMLDDHLTVRRVALAALTKVTGHDAPHPDNQPPRNTAERIALWKDWFQRQDNSVDGRR
jgi:HEAT repeat protein